MTGRRQEAWTSKRKYKNGHYFLTSMRTYKVPPKPRTDDGHLELIAKIIFIMWFNWNLVEERWPAIKRAFKGFAIRKVVAMDVEDVIDAPGMIRNRMKIQRIIENAKVCSRILDQYGSMQAWVKAVAKEHEKSPLFNPSLEEECQQRFAGIGETTREWVAYVFRDGKKCTETITE